MGVWDTPPTAAEAKGSVWDTPPTPQEMGKPAAPPGWPETAVDHFAHGGLMGFSDEGYGLGRAIGDKAGQVVGADVRAGSFGDLYRHYRDQRRGQLAAEKQAHPVVATGADIAGSLAPMLIPGLGAAAGTRAGAATVGGASAMLRGVGDSSGEIAPAALLRTGATGAVLGRAGYEIGALAAPAAAALTDKALELGRKVLNGGRRALSVKTPVSNAAVQEALDVGAILPFGTTKGAAARLGAEADAVGDTYSRIVAALEAKGIKGPDAQVLAQKIAAEGQAAGQQTLNKGVPAVYADVAEQLPGKAQGAMPLSQGEALKRSLQRKAKYDSAQPGADFDVNTARQDVASMLRQAVEDSIASGAPAAGPEAQAIAAQFVPIKQQYGRLAEASRTAERAAAQTANSGGPNLTDTIHMAAAPTLGGKLLAKLVASTWRQRGPSTMAWAADRAAPLVGKIGPGLTSRAGWTADEQLAQALADALASKEQPR